MRRWNNTVKSKRREYKVSGWRPHEQGPDATLSPTEPIQARRRFKVCIEYFYFGRLVFIETILQLFLTNSYYTMYITMFENELAHEYGWETNMIAQYGGGVNICW